MQRLRSTGIVLMILLLASCSRSGPKPIKDMVPLSQVTGVVTVNGKPVRMVFVACVATSEIKEKRKEYLSQMYAYTNDKGEFVMRTYRAGDGLPAGEYNMLFKLVPSSQAERDKEGDSDKLENVFYDMKKPYKTIKVEEGKALDVGTIDLKAPNYKGK